jgi:hypothetical protein
MGFHHGIGQRCPPFQRAHREDRKPPVFGQVPHAISIIALALPAQPGHSMRRHAGHKVCGKIDVLKIFQSIHQTIGSGGICANLNCRSQTNRVMRPSTVSSSKAANCSPRPA